MNRYLFVLLLLSQPLFAAANVIYLEPGANIQEAVDNLDATGGGTIYHAKGVYPVGKNSEYQDELVIGQTPISLVGAVDDAGAPTSIIQLIPDEDSSTQDAAIKIFDYIAGFGSGSEAGSNSEMRNLAIVVTAPNSCDNPATTGTIETNFSCEVSAGAIEIDGAEFVVIENVHIDGFGNAVRGYSYDAMGVSPFAIKIHTSKKHDDDDPAPDEGDPVGGVFDCADWLKINNSKLTNNYRGFVATGCSNGYVTDTLIEYTGPGAAVYVKRKGNNGGASFNFLDVTIQDKASGSGAPEDKDYLVYLTLCGTGQGDGCGSTNLINTNTSLMNSETDVGTVVAGAKHFYVNSGQNMLFNHTFINGSHAIISTDELPNSVKNNIVGPRMPHSSLIAMLTNVNPETNKPRNHVWNLSQDIDDDGFYVIDDKDDDNDGVLDTNDLHPINNQLAGDHDGDLVDSLVDDDDDGDAINDTLDNCSFMTNVSQMDSDSNGADGYGNACDGDLNNDDIVNIEDLRILADAALLSWVNTAVGKMPATTVPHIKPESEVSPDLWYEWVKASTYEPGDSGLSCAGVSPPCPAP